VRTKLGTNRPLISARFGISRRYADFSGLIMDTSLAPRNSISSCVQPECMSCIQALYNTAGPVYKVAARHCT
jgi:hypothetical protein